MNLADMKQLRHDIRRFALEEELCPFEGTTFGQFDEILSTHIEHHQEANEGPMGTYECTTCKTRFDSWAAAIGHSNGYRGAMLPHKYFIPIKRGGGASARYASVETDRISSVGKGHMREVDKSEASAVQRAFCMHKSPHGALCEKDDNHAGPHFDGGRPGELW